jgi:hypothetical protein
MNVAMNVITIILTLPDGLRVAVGLPDGLREYTSLRVSLREGRTEEPRRYAGNDGAVSDHFGLGAVTGGEASLRRYGGRRQVGHRANAALVVWFWSVRGDTMSSLHLGIAAPSQTTFLVSLALAVVAWISYFAAIPYIGEHPSALLTVAFAYLAAGCLLAF